MVVTPKGNRTVSARSILSEFYSFRDYAENQSIDWDTYLRKLEDFDRNRMSYETYISSIKNKIAAIQGADYMSYLISFVQIGMGGTNATKDFFLTSTNPVYATLGKSSKILGKVSFGANVVVTVIETKELFDGKISTGRYIYHLGSGLAAWGIGLKMTALVGGPVGVVAGGIAAGTFVGGEIMYDKGKEFYESGYNYMNNFVQSVRTGSFMYGFKKNENMMHLKYNYKNQLKGFWFWLDVCIISLIGIGILYYQGIIELKMYVFIVYFGYMLVMGFPLLLYHIRYYLCNRGQVIDIYDDRLVLTTRKGERMEYLFSEIVDVFLYRSRAIEPGGGFTFSPMDYYCYLKLTFEEEYLDEDRCEDEMKPPVYITCFMHPDLDEVIKQLKGVNVIVCRSMFL